MKATMIFLTTVLFAITAAVAAQDSKKNETVDGSGVIKSEKRDVEKFNSVTLDGAVDVDVKIGDKAEVIVEGDDNVRPYVITEVKDNTLIISTKKNVALNNARLKVSVTTPSLAAVNLNGSGDISIDGLKEDSLAIDIDGSGDITAKGKVQNLKCHINGSGDMELNDLEAKSVDIDIAGSGDAELNALETLRINISGSGDVEYKNNASLKIVKKILGSGEISVSEQE